MADKYLNLQGLTEVAEYVNQKLRTVTTMPASPELNDIVLYNGASSANFQQGSIYLYTTIETYYEWTDLTNTYYTKAEEPEVGDIVYSDTSGTDSGYTIEAFDDLNNQVTINSLTYDRDSTGDTPVNAWVTKGGTSVILNGQDKTGDVADFYAPTNSGNVGQVLVSNGENTAPTWESYSGYSPTIVDNYLYFSYGTLPSVEDNAIVFTMD